jgi:serine/threonine-protein kinase
MAGALLFHQSPLRRVRRSPQDSAADGKAKRLLAVWMCPYPDTRRARASSIRVRKPDRLGQYEIRRLLGQGGMGVVYEGFAPQIQRRVAIKTIRAQLLDGDEAAADPQATQIRKEMDSLRARFQCEAQAAGRLNHRCIVKVYEYREDTHIGADGRAVSMPYIAMELVEGRELKSPLDSGERFPLPQILKIMDELLEALAHAHAHGVVHRDIKPANILVLADGSIKITDFGIARVESSALGHAPASGTAHYMAPEQLQGEQSDGRADLYAAGVVLYELLTGDRPFAGAINTVPAKVLTETPVPPSELSIRVPKAFDPIVARALAKRPETRFQTAEEFREALRSAATASAAGRRGPGCGLVIGAAAVLAIGGAGFMIRRPSLSDGAKQWVSQAMLPADRATGRRWWNCSIRICPSIRDRRAVHAPEARSGAQWRWAAVAPR